MAGLGRMSDHYVAPVACQKRLRTLVTDLLWSGHAVLFVHSAPQDREYATDRGRRRITVCLFFMQKWHSSKWPVTFC